MVTFVVLAVIWQTMSSIRTLGVNVMLMVYLLWLVRGTLLRPQSNGDLAIVSNEFIGASVSLLLAIAALVTFIDRRILTKPVQMILIGCYLMLLMVPHICSMSYGLSQLQIYIRSVVFTVVWLAEDYVFSLRAKKDRSFDGNWWLSHVLSIEYMMTMIRSVWILFVHEFLMLFLLLFALMWLINIGVINLPKGSGASSNSSESRHRSKVSATEDDNDSGEDIERGNNNHRPRRRQVQTFLPNDRGADERALVPANYYVGQHQQIEDMVRIVRMVIEQERSHSSSSSSNNNNDRSSPQRDLRSSITITDQLSPSTSRPSPPPQPAAAAAASPLHAVVRPSEPKQSPPPPKPPPVKLTVPALTSPKLISHIPSSSSSSSKSAPTHISISSPLSKSAEVAKQSKLLPPTAIKPAAAPVSKSTIIKLPPLKFN
jgi:hypothetical protein